MRQSLDQTQGSISELLSWHICLFCSALWLPDTWYLSYPTTWVWELPHVLDFCTLDLSCSAPPPPLPLHYFSTSDNPSPFLSAQHFSAWNLQGEPCSNYSPWWQMETVVLPIYRGWDLCLQVLPQTPLIFTTRSSSPLLVNEQAWGGAGNVTLPTQVLRDG